MNRAKRIYTFFKHTLWMLFMLGTGVLFSPDRAYAQESPAFGYQVNDTVSVQVQLVSQQGHPLHYSSHLVSDVCSDGLCKPIHLTVYWDLLGNFQSYKTDPFHPLTKFDHIKMTMADHQQLHKILSDTASILRDYWVEDMIDTSVKIQSNTLDAVTGATMKTFDGATVEGALYTVYTLWHFINGGIRKEILRYTDAQITDLQTSPAIIAYMLTSGKRDYVSYILEKASRDQLQPFTSEIIDLIGNADMYIPHFALNWLPEAALEDPQTQQRITAFLPKVDSHLQNAILLRFKEVTLQPEGISGLIAAIKDMQPVQVEKITDLLYTNKSHSDSAQWAALKQAAGQVAPESQRVIQALLRKVE